LICKWWDRVVGFRREEKESLFTPISTIKMIKMYDNEFHLIRGVL